LASSLRSEKVVVATAQAIGVFAADARPRVVNSAPSLFKVEKLADPFEDVILLVAKNAVAEGNLGVPLLGLFIRYAEVGCYSKQVALGDFNTVIAATICGALETIKQHVQRAAILFHLIVINDSGHYPAPRIET